MARIRTIKPEFFRHEGLYEAERETGLPLRVAFAGLWTASDRAGRFRWAPRQLKLDCVPFDDVDFSRVLDALATRGFIVKYVVGEKEFGAIPSWGEHQIINNREKPSSLPEPNENNTLTSEARVDDASVTRLKQNQGEGKGREGKGEDAPTAPLLEVVSRETPSAPPPVPSSDEAQLFDRGKRVLGKDAGGLIAKLLKAKKGSVPEARAAIEMASTKQNAREYVGRVIAGQPAEFVRHSMNDPNAGIL